MISSSLIKFSWYLPEGRFTRYRLCRMRYAYDKSRTWIVSCKSNLQHACDCCVRHEEWRRLLKHVLKPYDNRSDRQFYIVEMVYDFVHDASSALKIAYDNRKQKSARSYTFSTELTKTAKSWWQSPFKHGSTRSREQLPSKAGSPESDGWFCKHLHTFLSEVNGWPALAPSRPEGRVNNPEMWIKPLVKIPSYPYSSTKRRTKGHFGKGLGCPSILMDEI